MRQSNTNLHKAREAKSDEFYTQLSDIEDELKYYKKYFKNKTVFCNCDDPYESNFWEYFGNNFRHLELKKLISTHYNPKGKSYKLEIYKDINGDGKIDKLDTIKTPLNGNGDFRSDECIDILKEADIVVTNPPFSLFREYIAQLIEHKKKFLVIGSMNAITYKNVFPLIKNNKIWLGIKAPKNFLQPNGEIKSLGNINWYTNLKHKRRSEELILYKKYNKKDYPKYDNYGAINVDKVSDIPKNYYGIMGVPITFLGKYNPKQFEIVKFRKGNDEKDLSINGKCSYFRILIKRR